MAFITDYFPMLFILFWMMVVRYYLILIPSLIFSVNYFLCHRRFSKFSMALLCLVMVYGGAAGPALYWNWRYDFELNKFDLNGDGFFTNEEIPPAQEEAVRKVTSDTGRSFAIHFAPHIAVIYSVGFYCILTVLGVVKKQKKQA